MLFADTRTGADVLTAGWVPAPSSAANLEQRYTETLRSAKEAVLVGPRMFVRSGIPSTDTGTVRVFPQGGIVLYGISGIPAVYVENGSSTNFLNISDRLGETRRQGDGSIALENVYTFSNASIQSLVERLHALPECISGSDLYEVDISSSVLDSAVAFLTQLVTLLVRAGEPWFEPNIGSEDDGDIVFSWWYGTKSLAISITDLNIYYLKVWGPHIENEMQEGVYN